MNPEKVVVSAEDDSCVIYAEVGGIILGIRLDAAASLRIGHDLLDRARIIMKASYPETQAAERNA